jgi:predicted methyltransferase
VPSMYDRNLAPAEEAVVAPEIDLKAAINAVSDVIQNRPRPIREFDQIYMKTGDMVMQSELVASWAAGKQLAFIGDGDAISVCVAYLHARDIIGYGPSRIIVYDFDERIVGAINRFADRERLATLEGKLYNCLDEFPSGRYFDCFYTNPPWGASNDGESVNLFVERGIEALGYEGEGLVVIADDEELAWPKVVLGRVQTFAAAKGFFVSRMMPRLHEYHLDDNPNLKSCNLIFTSLPGNGRKVVSMPITDPGRLQNFYGLAQQPRVRYVRERKRVDYGMASDEEYEFEYIRDGGD